MIGKGHILKKANIEEKADDSKELDAIKNFQSEKYKASDYNIYDYRLSGRPRYRKKTYIYQVIISYTLTIGSVLALIIGCMNNNKGESIWHGLFSQEAQMERAEKKAAKGSDEYAQCEEVLEEFLAALAKEDIEAVRDCLAIELNEYLDLSDLQAAIDISVMDDFWGEEAKYTYMEYESGSETKDYMVFDVIFSNSMNKSLTFEKCEDGSMRIVPDFMLAQNTVVTASSRSVLERDEVKLLIDGEEMDLECNIYQDKYGATCIEYVIPVLVMGNHELVIETPYCNYTAEERISSSEEEIFLRK